MNWHEVDTFQDIVAIASPDAAGHGPEEVRKAPYLPRPLSQRQPTTSSNPLPQNAIPSRLRPPLLSICPLMPTHSLTSTPYFDDYCFDSCLARW